jgi:predicted acyltransferase
MAANAQVLVGSEQQTKLAAEVAGRLASLDVIRGLAVAGMILVVTPGSWDQRYSQLLHAEWYGWTLADMVFPMFLFAVGMAVMFSFSSHFVRGGTKAGLARKILRRTLTIFILGLVLNLCPTFDLPHLRIPGILQRISVCYLLAGVLCLALWRSGQTENQTMFKRLAAVALAILIAYWVLLRFVPVPGFGAGRLDSLGSLPAYIDRQVFTIPHLWPYGTTPGVGVTYDPEGILSTVPATVTVLLGVLCGLWIKFTTKTSKRVLGMVLAGVGCLLLGFALNPLIPIIKKIWTPSFVFYSGGFTLVVLACCYWLCDVRGMRAWSYPLRVLGSNAILAFTVSQLIGDYLDKPWAIRASCFALLHSFVPNATVASFMFALLNLLLIIAILAPLHHRRIFLRV